MTKETNKSNPNSGKKTRDVKKIITIGFTLTKMGIEEVAVGKRS